MSARLDSVLQKHPEHEDGMRLLASRDPSGNLKYLDWGAKVLASGQALAPEVADVIDLFHRFRGRIVGRPSRSSRRNQRHSINPDLYTYHPQDLATLRDGLLKIKRATDTKRRKRERLYRIEGQVDVDVVYDSEDLVVRHIKNKQASIHYGHDTKWCIAMLREHYFDDYETQNAVFFFFERKAPRGDEFDKVALMVPRSDRDAYAQAFTALDDSVDMLELAKVYGPRVFDIFRAIYDRSVQHPPSAMFQVYAGNATAEQLASVFAASKRLGPFAKCALLEAICCNDAAPWPLLKEVRRRAVLIAAAWEKRRKTRRKYAPHRARRYHRRGGSKNLKHTVLAALVIHPQVPPEVREALVQELRRHHIDVNSIERTVRRQQISVSYTIAGRVQVRGAQHVRRLRRAPSVRTLRSLAQTWDRRAKRLRRQARTLQRKETAAARKAAQARKRKGASK